VKDDVGRYQSELDSILSEMDTLKEVRRDFHTYSLTVDMLPSAIRICKPENMAAGVSLSQQTFCA